MHNLLSHLYMYATNFSPAMTDDWIVGRDPGPFRVEMFGKLIISAFLLSSIHEPNHIDRSNKHER